ncbi:MAG: type II toxin-antitoxin system Phd/YefM family antitoxin [Thiobacillaceae bacterium]
MKDATKVTLVAGHEGTAMNVNAAEFKARCLKLIDEVATTHKPLVITKRGKPMAKLVSIEVETPTKLFGYMNNIWQILGDIVDVPHDRFAAESGEEDDLYTDFKPNKEG